MYGFLSLEERQFEFEFEEGVLSLHPLNGEIFEYAGMLRDEVPYATIPGNLLIGTRQPGGQRVVFGVYGSVSYTTDFPNPVSIMGMRLNVNWIATFTSAKSAVKRLVLEGKEIDGIYPVARGAKQQVSYGLGEEDPQITIEVSGSKDSTSKSFAFKMNEREITLFFAIQRSLNHLSGTPLVMKSLLYITLPQPETDYAFIKEAHDLACMFVKYASFRANISIGRIRLQDEEKRDIGILRLLDNGEMIKESNRKSEDEYLHLHELEAELPALLNRLVQNAVYLEHLPVSYRDRRRISAASFILHMAAFEWEYRQLYPDGTPHKAKTIKAQEVVTFLLEELVKKTISNIKKILRNLLKFVDLNNLEEDVVRTCKRYEATLMILGKHLYQRCPEEFSFRKIGKRLRDQRNAFAHGKLEILFDRYAALDILFLQHVIYYMQFDSAGYDIGTLETPVVRMLGYVDEHYFTLRNREKVK